jgi:hypothetical protein
MVQMIVLGLSGLCLMIGLYRRFSPPGHLEGEELKKQQSEATKLIIVSAIAAAIGVGISFV